MSEEFKPITLPVGNDTPRPSSILEGTFRDYVTETHECVDTYLNGKWEPVIRQPRKVSDE
jgi:hypothetical protein